MSTGPEDVITIDRGKLLTILHHMIPSPHEPGAMPFAQAWVRIIEENATAPESNVSEIDSADTSPMGLQGDAHPQADPTDAHVHAAAVAIDPAAWEPGIFYFSDSAVWGRDYSLEAARAALRAAFAVVGQTHIENEGVGPND